MQHFFRPPGREGPWRLRYGWCMIIFFAALILTCLNDTCSVDDVLLPSAGGELKPGKKGIALSPDDWAKVCSEAEAATQAAARKDASYVVPLSGKRQLGISEFKGKVYVGIREYYEKVGCCCCCCCCMSLLMMLAMMVVHLHCCCCCCCWYGWGLPGC
jgi:hypothetical protein